MDSIRDLYWIDEIIEYIQHHIDHNEPLSNAQIDPNDPADEKEYKIALQFPDHLINDSIFVTDSLQSHFDDTLEDKAIVFFILGDTSYAEWCVDEVNAQHYCDQTDLILHFGRTCLTPSITTKTVFVLERNAIKGDISLNAFDQIDIEDKMLDHEGMTIDNTLLFADWGYQYLMQNLGKYNYLVFPTNEKHEDQSKNEGKKS